MLTRSAIRRTVVALAVAGVGLIAVRAAPAQGPTIVTPANLHSKNGDYQFSVKFLCGTISSEPAFPLAAGIYLTVINIHNFGTNSTHFIVSVNGTFVQDRVLGAGQVFSYDCGITAPGFSPSTAFSEGFVFIKRGSDPSNTGHSAHVVAVYTLAP